MRYTSNEADDVGEMSVDPHILVVDTSEFGLLLEQESPSINEVCGSINLMM